MDRICKNCKFWKHGPNKAGLYGECHVNAPQVDDAATRWPMTAPTDFCGQFKANSAKQLLNG